LPEVQKKRGADVDFQAGWAHVSNQAHQVNPKGVSDWWRESVRKSVSVHQDKIRGSAILKACEVVVLFKAGLSALGASVSASCGPEHASAQEVLMRVVHL